jgi:hypothetical protein
VIQAAPCPVLTVGPASTRDRDHGAKGEARVTQA